MATGVSLQSRTPIAVMDAEGAVTAACVTSPDEVPFLKLGR